MAFAKSSVGLWSALALCAMSVSAANVHPALPEVKTVYLLSMTHGLDQYLANRLTKQGRFEVVTDPAKADAIFTDRLGQAFEQRWAELYPPPPAPEAPKPEPSAKKGTTPDNPMDFAAPSAARISSFARSRGNVFLVSRESRAVLWSHYRQASDARPSSLDKLADRIVDRLIEDLTPKKP